MKTQTPNEFALELAAEFTDNLITLNITLIEALDKEQYELAAKVRDEININIESIILQTNHLLGISTEILRKHFKENNEYAFINLKKAYENK